MSPLRPRVTLTIVEGPLRGARYTISGPARWTIGRGEDCEIRFPDDDGHDSISGRHCLLVIEPPAVRVRDLGSANGTFLNGVLIGCRDDVRSVPFPEYDLHDGDDIRVGVATVLRVRIAPDPERTVVRRRPARVCPNCGRTVGGDCPGCDRDSALLLREAAARQDDAQPGGFELVRRLGAGAAGVVWLARDRDGNEMALKIVHPEHAASPHAVSLFRREIATLRGLEHEHVVRVFAEGDYLGRPYFTSEYCDAGSLHELLLAYEADGRRLPMERAVTIALDVLDALDHAHRAPVAVELASGEEARAVGIVHRDIAPGNILFRRGGSEPTVKVSDFGLAKAFDTAGLTRLTRSGAVNLVGTPGYMPRQQALDLLHAGPEVDVYATAACLYRMLTGSTPRDLPRGAKGIRLLQHDPPRPVPVRERARMIPARLARAVDAALVDDPHIVVRTAAELRQSLVSAL